MAERHLVLCGGVKASSQAGAWKTAPKLAIKLGDGPQQVHLKLRHIRQDTLSHLPHEAIDLLEIATYVYAADQIVGRGGQKQFEYGYKWRRHFRFEIPVRNLTLWRANDLPQKLAQTLGFLSDDDYEFAFSQQQLRPRDYQRYLFKDAEDEGTGFEEVILFSGGLDSFGGAVHEILEGHRKVVLVSHRPVNKLYTRQCKLVDEINSRVTDSNRRPLHVAVEVNKSKDFSSDPSQRTRSFLFASMAAVVAQGYGRDRIRFYENGIVSFNLPLGAHEVGARATRTTHPKVLHGFQELFSLIFNKAFTVENPFLWKTKADVFRGLKSAGAADLCKNTGSCTHTKSQTKVHTHCGRCSQCVDRRLNALAAGFADDEDPAGMYASDVVTGTCRGNEVTLVERYVGVAREIDKIATLHQFMERFPELSRLVNHLGMDANKAATAVFNLYRRHAHDICRTMIDLVKSNGHALFKQVYPPNCLLSIAVGRTNASALTDDGLPSPIAEPDGQLDFQDGTFVVSSRGKKCELRNTLEYKLLKYLADNRGTYVPNQALADRVWANDQTGNSAIQRAASNLRRCLKTAGITWFIIDGTTNKGHYSLQTISD